MNKLLSILTLVVGLTLATSVKAEQEKVFFATDKAELSSTELSKLNSLAEKAKASGSKIVIVGNADKRGSRLYNLDLGARRAASALKALQDAGVPDEQLVVSLSQGEEKPMAPADSLKEHLAANRRVDVLLVDAEAKMVVVTRDVEVVREVKSYRKNRIGLLGGVGPLTLDKKTITPTHFVVEQNYEPVFGLQYQRSLNSRFNIGAAAFTNNSYFLSLGLDF